MKYYVAIPKVIEEVYEVEAVSQEEAVKSFCEGKGKVSTTVETKGVIKPSVSNPRRKWTPEHFKLS